MPRHRPPVLPDSDRTISDSYGGAAANRRGTKIAVAVFALAATLLLAGGASGYWAARTDLFARVERFLAYRLGWATRATSTVDAQWQARNTLLVKLETSEVWLPGAEGMGGGIHALGDERILYATRTGGFGLLGSDGVARPLPFHLDLNLDALKRHPIYGVENFNRSWFRVTDIDIASIAPDRFELLVGHHWFDPKRQCVELRLSRATLRSAGNEVSIDVPFRTVVTTEPCITFFHEGYEWAFEGHFSGGRIARLDATRVLFSTGDHGWVGLRGYPELAQDDKSTLGKVLLVELETGKVSTYATGVRNPQGLAVDSLGRVWETEHGPRGGDELNLIVAGRNYGWPDSTYGTDYGPRPWPLNQQQGRHATHTPPRFAWVPSIGISNLVAVHGDEFALWKGDLLVTSLVGNAIHRLRLEGDLVVYDEKIDFEGERLRDIIELPSGRLAMLTDRGTLLLLRNADLHGAGPFLDAASQQRRTADMSASEQQSAVAGRYALDVRSSKLPPAHALEPEPLGAIAFHRHCAGCHSMYTPAASVGPTLRGVVGRRVGSTEFGYSSALSGRQEVWTISGVLDFAQNPASIYPGTRMPAVKMSPKDRKLLESYLVNH